MAHNKIYSWHHLLIHRHLRKRQRSALQESTIEALQQKRKAPPSDYVLVLPAGFESACDHIKYIATMDIRTL